ncbi:hypothetical protein BT67DRAFT_375213 [Trichocladium antarcticum]|uniref:Uncharacterized protein n=1 Tax=Trichocladium antarcticum TaxID=1450529 RepID=A0AAN6UN83_9PEZI|nr:hypothetical protein BT67DRAFT_375213 [Trichocladium antarcticum]
MPRIATQLTLTPTSAHDYSIDPILANLGDRLGFSSRDALVRWLTSDQVRPHWREFRRDCLAAHPLGALRNTNGTAARRRRAAERMGGRAERPGMEMQRALDMDVVQGLVMGDGALRRLGREAADKRPWDANCHAAWFVAGVATKVWRDREMGSAGLLPDTGDLEPITAALAYDLVSVLLALVAIEKRRPGWGPGTDDEEED